MTKTQVIRRIVAAVCGATGAVALAIGVALIVLWTFDSANVTGDMPELIGASLAIACGAACVFARRRLLHASHDAASASPRAEAD